MISLGVLGIVLPKIMEAASGGELVTNLLTGGGFMFLAALMGGLALWNKNQSESISAINKASQEFVEGARAEVAAARKDALAARKDSAAARNELEELQEAAELERRKFRRWIRLQKIANDDFQIWATEATAELERLGGHIRDAPALATISPDDPMFPSF